MLQDTTKKCPYCSVNLAIDDDTCFSCKNKVGEPNEYGIAKKPINWTANFTAVIAIAAFLGFMYWIFFIKGQGGG